MVFSFYIRQGRPHRREVNFVFYGSLFISALGVKALPFLYG